MALIDCPECGTQVSDRAEKCLRCAYPISANLSNNRNAQNRTETNVVVKSGEGCFLQTLNTGCMIIAVLIGVFILIGVLGAL